MKKGFTLIELLAVIIILSIIALISIPIINNIVEESAEKAFVDSGYGIAKAAEYLYVEYMTDGVKQDIIFTYTDGIETSSVNGKILNYKGEKPKNGQISLTETGETSFALHNGEYCIRKEYSSNEVEISKDILEDCTMPWMFIPFSPTTISADINLNLPISSYTHQMSLGPSEEIHYFYWNTSNSSILGSVVDLDGNVIRPNKTLVTGVQANNYNEYLKNFDVVVDDEGNSYIGYLNYSSGYESVRIVKIDSAGNVLENKSVFTEITSGDSTHSIALEYYNDNIFIITQDTYPKIIEIDKDLNVVTSAKTLGNSSGSMKEISFRLKENKVYLLYTLAGSTSLTYSVRLGIYDMTTGSLIRTINVPPTSPTYQRRLVGDLEIDSLGNLWVLTNAKLSAENPATAYKLISNDTAFDTGITINTNYIHGYTNSLIMSNGEIAVFFGNGNKYNLLQK